jgi:hypothetical protein
MARAIFSWFYISFRSTGGQPGDSHPFSTFLLPTCLEGFNMWVLA